MWILRSTPILLRNTLPSILCVFVHFTDHDEVKMNEIHMHISHLVVYTRISCIRNWTFKTRRRHYVLIPKIPAIVRSNSLLIVQLILKFYDITLLYFTVSVKGNKYIFSCVDDVVVIALYLLTCVCCVLLIIFNNFSQDTECSILCSVCVCVV